MTEQPPVPGWVRVRVAHPTADLEACVAFYGGLLGLPYEEQTAAPYELVFFALPGGAQLELTAGGPAPRPVTPDDLLVLYLSTAGEVAALRQRLAFAGVPAEEPLNPYWARTGVTVRDPDGRLVVVAQLPA